MKKTKKILSILILIIILFSNISNIFAKSLSLCENVNLVYGHDCISVLRTKGQEFLKQVAYVYYEDPETGVRYPAFCVEPADYGIGTGAGDEYDVTVDKLDDPVLWRILYYGYVGRNYQSWGLECDDDLYFATKTAVHSYVEGIAPMDKYELPHRVGYGDEEYVTLEDVQRRGEKVLNVAQTLYEMGLNNSNENYIVAKVTITENSRNEETIDGTKYLVQNYFATANKELSSYDVNVMNFPVGTRVLNTSNVDSTTMTNSEFKIAIPVSSLTENFTGLINITEAKVKSYPIFYGSAPENELQDYVFIDPSEVTTARGRLDVDVYNSSLRIVKVDDENRPVEGAVFNVKYEDGTNIGDYTTNANGEIVIDGLKQGKVIAKEISSHEKYILDSSERVAVIDYNSTTTLNITNALKRGNLKIIKVDKDNNQIRIPGVEFQLIDSEENIVGSYNTNDNGEINIQGLKIGNYKLVEKNAGKWYDLAKDTEITIEWNKTKTITIENELIKGQIKIIKVDLDDNEVKLKGIKFEVLDDKENLLETIVTDENGEAVTKEYPIRDYKTLTLREIETNEIYVLNDKPQTIELEAHQIKNVTFENEKIKGQIRIIKTSKDDNFINDKKKDSPISNVKFEVYDSNRRMVDEITTNEEGVAITKMLLKGIYYIKEVEAGKWYLLNNEEYSATIKDHKQIIDINIKNESEKPHTEIEKTGIIQTTASQEIKYDFKFSNAGNVPLSNFNWTDELPTDYVRITKLITGTYNQDLNYNIYYKTNLRDYKLLKENLNTKENHYIDFTKKELAEDEYITNFKIDFGKVDVGFTSEINPYIFVKTLDSVKNKDTFINKTRIEGDNKGWIVWDEDDHKTEIYEKKIETKKLPRTGF